MHTRRLGLQAARALLYLSVSTTQRCSKEDRDTWGAEALSTLERYTTLDIWSLVIPGKLLYLLRLFLLPVYITCFSYKLSTSGYVVQADTRHGHT